MLVPASGVLAYANNFTGNVWSAQDDSATANHWDDGYPVGGNYWSDYRGWDDCHGPLQDNCTAGDGLGDFPYVISGMGAEDHYPLVPVNPPKVWPVAIVSADATDVLAGQTVVLRSTSYDPTGWPLRSQTWDFGDGTNATGLGNTQYHAYAAAGNYTVTLTVESQRRLTNTTSLAIHVTEPAPLALVDYDSPRGYIIPVPVGWSRTYNLSEGGNTYELFLQGTVGGLPSNMLVDTEPVAGVVESTGYLTSAIEQIVQSVQQSLPDAYLDGSPQWVLLSGHLGAVFDIGYTAHPIFQCVLLVVSAAHAREWEAILTGPSTARGTLNATFARVVQGFSITAAPPTPSPTPTSPPSGGLPAEVVLSAILLAAAAVVLFLGWWSRKRSRAMAPTPSGFCARCGAALEGGANFCQNCGAPVAPGPPPGP